MEVGAVKQAFNNELILMKKKLSQAKIQVIHKLTRKAKTLAEKKAPDPLKEKLKRKAESAVNEVLIIKKIKAKDIGKFILTHTGELKDHLNKPQVDESKACARLLLHRALEDKYKFIRGRFSGIPIKDLFMSRQERRKLKKEEKEKQKEKQKAKQKKREAKNIGAEEKFDVQDVEMADSGKESGDDDDDDDDDEMAGGGRSSDEGTDVEQEEETHGSEGDDQCPGSEDDQAEADVAINDDSRSEDDQSDAEVANDDDEKESSSDGGTEVGRFVRLTPAKVEKTVDKKLDTPVQNKELRIFEKRQKKEVKEKPEKKQKASNKNKNFNEKIQNRKFKKEEETSSEQNKIVDPFFITSTGENYMSVAEPRQPDEVKEVHRQGNRQTRRAAMFGHVPKIKPRSANFYDGSNNRFNKQNGFNKDNDKQNRFNNKQDRFGNDNFKQNRFQNNSSGPRDNKFGRGNERSNFKDRSNQEDPKPEKLHPSWEAKKRQSGILPFQGKKIVFDES